MKKRVFTSVAASAVLAGVLVLSGCGNSSSGTTGGNTAGDGGTSGGAGNASAEIRIQTGSGQVVSVDPATGGTVVVGRNNDGTQNVATVVRGELNDCATATSDPDGDGIICGPKEGVTYVFQTDFGALGPVDNNISTPDGGALLFDALTVYGSNTTNTPVEGNVSENRIQEVYIPANYLKTTDDFKAKPVNEQYEAMKKYLENVCNMQCMAAENDNNPYFKDGKTEGEFLATYVMWFTRGTGEDTLKQQFASGNADNLEYLLVQFPLKVTQEDNNSSKLRFTVPADADVVFGGKKAGAGQTKLTVTTKNDVINSVLHESQNYVHPNFTINMAKYFNKLIAKGEGENVADYAKEILVENAQHPWPVKIYGVLHEKKSDGTYDRSFIRNPGKVNGMLFNIFNGSNVFGETGDADKSAVPAIKFNIVYPGGNYNNL